MAKKPIWGASSSKASTPAPRRIDLERTLCDAIRSRLTVYLRYDDDYMARLFAPYGVYYSSTGKLLVVGVQIDNPAEPMERFEPRNLEVAKIRELRLSEQPFSIDNRFNPHDERYRKGFICRV